MLIARHILMLLFATFSAAMLGLAAGAVWMLPTLFLQHSLPWLAVPAGWLLGLAVRNWVRPAGAIAALLAALATLLAAAYLGVLVAAARVAGAMGLGLVDALREAGPGMLFQLAQMALSPAATGWFLAGALVAAITAWRQPGTRQPPPR